MNDKLLDITIPIACYLGISQIESILGVVLLILQLILILYKCGYKIYLSIKHNKYEEIGTTIEETIEDTKELIERGKDNE